MKYAVYQKYFSGRWYPLFAQVFSTRPEALAAIRKMTGGDEDLSRYFKIKRIGGAQ